MVCDYPIKAYRSPVKNPETGKSLIQFNSRKGYGDRPIDLPCGKCEGCRLDKAREWSIRLMHESRSWPASEFVTLTYSDKFLPSDYGVHKPHFQDFMKRLRYHYPGTIRYFACGEYGEQFLRPHYHAIIFNLNLTDKVHYQNTPHGPLYTSEKLTDIWGMGHVSTGAVTPASCGYVARYTLKKVTGNRAPEFYARIHPYTHEVHTVEPEFRLCSLKPPLGSNHAREFKSDYYPSGFLVVDGVKAPVPRAYKRLLSEDEQEQLKIQAMRAAHPRKKEETPMRRHARAVIRAARMYKLNRKAGDITNDA